MAKRPYGDPPAGGAGVLFGTSYSDVGHDITYVIERWVVRRREEGLDVTELAPGLELQREVLAQATTPLDVASDLKVTDAVLFKPERFGLTREPA